MLHLELHVMAVKMSPHSQVIPASSFDHLWWAKMEGEGLKDLYDR